MVPKFAVHSEEMMELNDSSRPWAWTLLVVGAALAALAFFALPVSSDAFIQRELIRPVLTLFGLFCVVIAGWCLGLTRNGSRLLG